MASMRLTLPSAFMHSDNTDALMDALRNHVDVDDPQFSLRKAVSAVGGSAWCSGRRFLRAIRLPVCR